jgi:ATP-binding cassette, subfamily B, bacterial CvaB/MchF/RaxB
MSWTDGLNFAFRRKLPLVLQTEVTECGLACLAMIADYHGRFEDLASLRRRFGVSLKGVRLPDLVRIADQMGLASRPLRLSLAELSQLRTPCILHWDMNHFVVLREVTRQSVVIHDPASGVRRISREEVGSHFTGIALELNPTQQFRPRKAQPSLSILQALGRMVGLKRSLAQLMALALAIEVFSVTQPFFLQWVVDHALVSADRDLLYTLALGFGLLMLANATFTALRGWMLMVLSTSLRLQGRAGLFSHLMKLPVSFFEARYLGDIVSRFSSMETLQRAITTQLVEALLDGMFALATLAMMFAFSPAMAAVVVVAALIYAGMRWALYGPLREASMEAIVWAARRDSHFLETLRAVSTIKLMGGTSSRQVSWMNLLVQTLNRELAADRLRLSFRVGNQVLMGALNIGVVVYGASLVLAGNFTVGMLLAFLAFKNQFVTRICEVIDKGVDLKMLRLHSDRLADIVNTEPEMVSSGEVGTRLSRHPRLEVKQLRFRYSEHDPWVLDGINLVFEPGESVAIVGTSGCGKTTLLKILASLLSATEGEVLVDGKPINRVGTENYRRLLGVVMQDDQLLAGSIAENISFFAARPNRARIEACARMAALDRDITQMAMGYETLIGDMGTSISGGQKQRLLLARALYRKPRILLLDEATSHLDVKLERTVNEAVAGMHLTRIIVAHRPETIRTADRVITLEAGRVASDLRVARPQRALASGGLRQVK